MPKYPNKKDGGQATQKAIGSPEKRGAATYLVAEHRLSVQQSCRYICLSWAAYYRTPQGRDRDAKVIDAINRTLCMFLTSHIL